MGVLYHGSKESGLTRLDPHKSTHGDYVYATKNKDLAVLFSARCGDDFTYALYGETENGPWVIVERIPGAFDKMFSNSSSIYTVDNITFKDINTGFSEAVSEVSVNTNSEEHIDNVYAEVMKLAREGKFKIYTYPNKPKGFSEDNSDLIDKQIRQLERDNKPVTKSSFSRLVLMHPNLIEKEKKKMIELNINEEPYTKEDLVNLFENSVIQQDIYPENEEYIDLIANSIIKIYPELRLILDEKEFFFDKSKKEKISILFDKLSKIIPNNVLSNFQKLKEHYLNDSRDFCVIGDEILNIIKKSTKSKEKMIMKKKQNENKKYRQIMNNLL